MCLNQRGWDIFNMQYSLIKSPQPLSTHCSNACCFTHQQLLREMQQMASRPFASVNVALETDEEPPDLIGGTIKVRMWLQSPYNLICQNSCFWVGETWGRTLMCCLLFSSLSLFYNKPAHQSCILLLLFSSLWFMSLSSLTFKEF